MKNCPKYHAENPLDAKFCRKCGYNFNAGFSENNTMNSADDNKDVRPFHIRCPELHLRPISEFDKLFFWLNRPEYVEDPLLADDSNYLYIVRNEKIGILHWITKKHWYGKEEVYNRIIPCKYDRIEKADGYFICYKGLKVEYRDMKGNILR